MEKCTSCGREIYGYPCDYCGADPESGSNELNVSQGDLVDFGPYGVGYVCDPNYRSGRFWITDEARDRYDKNASGWNIRKEYATRVVEEG